MISYNELWTIDIIFVLIDICDIKPCGPYSCKPDAFGGYTCYDPCDPTPCHHNGTCNSTGDGKGGYTCECNGEYYGKNCEKGISNLKLHFCTALIKNLYWKAIS